MARLVKTLWGDLGFCQWLQRNAIFCRGATEVVCDFLFCVGGKEAEVWAPKGTKLRSPLSLNGSPPSLHGPTFFTWLPTEAADRAVRAVRRQPGAHTIYAYTTRC